MANALPLLLAVGAAFLLMRGKGGETTTEPENISIFTDGDLPNQIEQDHGYPALVIASNTLSIETLRARIRQAALDNPDINFGIIGSEEFSTLASQWGEAVDGVNRVTVAAARAVGLAQLDVMDIPADGISEEKLVAAVLAGVAYIRETGKTSKSSGFGLDSGTKQATIAQISPMSLSNNALSSSTSTSTRSRGPSMAALALYAWTGSR